MEVADYFEKFTDGQFYEDAGSALAGLLAAETVAAGVAGRSVPMTDMTIGADSGVDHAVGGAGVVVGAEAAPISGRMKRHVQVGGAVGIGHGVAERFGIADALQNAVSGVMGGS